MVRRTVTIPDSLDERVREQQRDGESFSAAVSRLLENGLEGVRAPAYFGAGEGGPDDSIRVDEIVREALDELEQSERVRR